MRTSLSAAQRAFLDRLGDSDLGGTFYLTGGTALRAFFRESAKSLIRLDEDGGNG